MDQHQATAKALEQHFGGVIAEDVVGDAAECVGELRDELLDHPSVREWSRQIWVELRERVIAESSAPGSALQSRLEQAVRSLRHALANDPDLGARVEAAAVDVARTVCERYGDEIRDPRFRQQFEGKTAADSLRASEEIIAVSGATISSRAMTVGVHRALVLLDELILSPQRPRSAQLAPSSARSLAAPTL